MQTYSFFGKQNPAGERVLAALKKKYRVKGRKSFAPVGTANAYDAMHILALAIAAGRHPPTPRGPGGARRSESAYGA